MRARASTKKASNAGAERSSPNPGAFRSSRTKPLGVTAYEVLKAAIVNCELQPGTETSQAELMGRYQVTVAQGRYALVRLAQEGWVTALPQRGYLVAPLTLKDLENVFAMRMMLEPPAMRIAAHRIDPETISHLRKIGVDDYVHGDLRSIRRFLALNREFYMTIINCTGNQLLVRTVDQLFDSANRLLFYHMVYSYQGTVVKRGHENLIDALEARDGEAAYGIRLSGLEHGKQVIQQALMSMSQIQDINIAV